MDCIVISDEDTKPTSFITTFGASQTINKYRCFIFYLNFVHLFFRSLFATNDTDTDELFAVEKQILEIDKQVNQLRQERANLLKRKQQLQELIKTNQNSTAKRLNEEWRRTGL